MFFGFGIDNNSVIFQYINDNIERLIITYLVELNIGSIGIEDLFVRSYGCLNQFIRFIQNFILYYYWTNKTLLISSNILI